MAPRRVLLFRKRTKGGKRRPNHAWRLQSRRIGQAEVPLRMAPEQPRRTRGRRHAHLLTHLRIHPPNHLRVPLLFHLHSPFMSLPGLRILRLSKHLVVYVKSSRYAVGARSRAHRWLIRRILLGPAPLGLRTTREKQPHLLHLGKTPHHDLERARRTIPPHINLDCSHPTRPALQRFPLSRASLEVLFPKPIPSTPMNLARALLSLVPALPPRTTALAPESRGGRA
ncbi:hypothetical protein B0J12DRAFT_265205 [Macrophomina phaseolina]|uniref:Uncharacterized protein n=1 Tax=Macrophomina phaseolina TaxID=35725 RepID=A0ABQ8FYM3_9PEZI|nr:hypothetical protein B0J12DRAFT_265205 [Macrophomina phaseolina]